MRNYQYLYLTTKDPNSSDNFLTVRFWIYQLSSIFPNLTTHYYLIISHNAIKIAILRSLEFVFTSLLLCPFPVKKTALRQYVHRITSGRIWLFIHIKRISLFFSAPQQSKQGLGRLVFRCLDHIQLDTPGRTPVNKRRSSSHRPQPPQHKTNKTDEKSWPQRGFETAIPTIERLQTYALDRTVLA
jgi:hypothetical protein